ncbi:protein-disulfide reductase DsbD [Candidatus Halobeggiatoa sp. HSG11]|nr:protein-disulfide reductase DsbD [Candidatus Halobeggiatoa sp. HSG11]
MTRFVFLTLLVWNCNLLATDFSQITDLLNPLDPDKAFILSADVEENAVSLHWKIAEGYYLYRDKFEFTLKKGGTLDKAEFPPAKIENDVKYGKTEVYEQQITIKLPFVDTTDIMGLEVGYQGCVKDRICYPPITKMLTINLINGTATIESTNSIEKNLISNNILSNLENSSINPQTETKPKDFSWLTPTEQAPTSQTKQEIIEPEFLDVEEAFIFSAEFANPDQILTSWKIADGYYLYRDKLKFNLTGGVLGAIELPPSKLKTDKFFGDVEIYQQPLLEINLPFNQMEKPNLTLTVKYQGCAFDGLCYPPITKIVNLTYPTGTDSKKTVNNISEQDRLANMLSSASFLYTIMIFFGLGVLLSLTPCIFPMIPILSGIIIGQGKDITTHKAFLMSLIYVVAMALTYAVVGALTAILGANLSAAFQTPWVLFGFAFVFIVLSLSMFGFYELQVPNFVQTKVTNISNKQQGGTLFGVAVMGVLSALIVGPCVAAPLVGALMYISQTGDWVLGGTALFTMGIGMGIPLLLIGLSAGHFLPKADQWMNAVKAVFGVMLLGVAIWMIERVIPAQITMLLWASLLIISAVYMGALDGVGKTGWFKLWKGIGFILLIYGVLLIVGVSAGSKSLLQPLQILTTTTTIQPKADNNQVAEFKIIKGISGLEHELAAAVGKPVILDFYADWCISCKEMEHFTFSDAEVQKGLANFVLLKADVTLNDAQDQALNKRFGIFGPPAILFFDSNGQEQRSLRIVGFMPAEEFSQHLKKVLQ